MSTISVNDLLDLAVAAGLDSDRLDLDMMHAYALGEKKAPSTISFPEEWGGEGQGESAGFVVQIHTRYFRVDFPYYSYDGYWYGQAEVTEVKPVRVEVTQYEPV